MEDLSLGILPPVEGLARSLSTNQKRAYALEYAQIRHGFKTAYLRRVGIDVRTLRGWQAALVDGDLDAGLIPVEAVRMSKNVAREIERLTQTIETLKSDYEQQLAAKNERIEALEKACDSLGKAINVVSKLTEEKDTEKLP